MTKRKMSVEVIASVLMEQFEQQEQYVKRIEQAIKQPLKIDTSAMKEYVSSTQKQMQDFDREIEKTKEEIIYFRKDLKRRFLVWGLILPFVLALFVGLSAYFYFGLYVPQKQQYEEQRAEYEELYNFATKQREELNLLKAKKK